jgi:hypothetical protein
VRPRFSIALLSEDHDRTWRGLRAVLEKLLERFEDDGYTPRVEIVPAEPSVRPVLLANGWESPKRDVERLELARYLARKISEPGGFVVFHFDGDRRWKDRARSARPPNFERLILLRVRQVLAAGRSAPSPAEIDRRLRRIIPCIPFYSTESWIYQAVEQAMALCRSKHGGAHGETFASWRADRTRLDDVWQPKDNCCLRDHHNEELGRHVPVWEVARAGGSFFFFLWSLHACGDLTHALAPPR